MLFSESATCQWVDSVRNPLEAFFQKHYDSTVIYQRWGTWNLVPDFHIIAKKDDSVYYYRYFRNTTKRLGRNMAPKSAGLEEKMFAEFFEIERVKPDINSNFYWLASNPLTGSLWDSLQLPSLWHFGDDRNAFLVKDASGYEASEDGGNDRFRLITKHQVKALNYYEPAEFNAFKENATRKIIIEIKSKWVVSFRELTSKEK